MRNNRNRELINLKMTETFQRIHIMLSLKEGKDHIKPCREHNSELSPWAEYWIDKCREMSYWQVWKAHLFPYLKIGKKFVSLTFFVNLKLVSTNVKKEEMLFKLSNLEMKKAALSSFQIFAPFYISIIYSFCTQSTNHMSISSKGEALCRISLLYRK